MKRTWTGRYKFFNNCKNMTGAMVKRHINMVYPSFTNFQLGDNNEKKIFLLPMPHDMHYIYDNLDDIRHEYYSVDGECEDFTQKRLSQIKDFTREWTDIPAGYTLANFEIRGYVYSESKSEWVGHSMLLCPDYFGEVQLREPYNVLIRRKKKPSYLENPWLIYS